MNYTIESKPASSNGWYTPAESNANYLTPYSRDNYICHWWGAPGTVGTHDQTVDYILGTAQAGKMSVNYVVSDTKITMLVAPENVTWGAQGGNPTGINVEHDPKLGAEGYKRAGWLKWQLEQKFGKQLGIKKHSDYFATQCPGTLDVARIERECAALRNGGNDVITKDDIGPLRIVMSEVEGWNGTDVHAGKHDAEILAAWQGRQWTEMLWHCWNQPDKHRQNLVDTIAELQKKLDAASTQASDPKLAALGKALKDYVK